MSDYTKTTNFAAKDSLPSGNSGKIVKGSEIDTEFTNIQTAVATKLNTNNGALTGTTTFETISDGSIAITAFVDEDNMSSNSATLVPTQQSVKAYVDSQVTAQDLDFQADSGGALSIDLDSETLTFTGGTGIDTSGSGNAVTFAIDSTVATLTGSQTLTNKSLTAPTLTGTAIVASLDISGDIDVDGTTNLDVVDIDGAVDMASTLTVADDLAVDTDTLFVDASTDRIGVGTTSPAEEIHISAALPTIRFEDSDGTNQYGQIYYNDGNFNFQSRNNTSPGEINFVSYDGTDIVSRLFIRDNGNVGIGDSSPSNALAINHSNPTIRLEDSDGSGAGIAQIQNTANGNLRLIADPNNDGSSSSTIEFEIDGSEKARFNSSGQLGLGTTSPSYTLDVAGSINVTDTSDALAATFTTPFDYIAKFESTDASGYIILEDSDSTSNANRIGAVGDTLRIESGNTENVRFESNRVIFNSPGADIDFRVESDDSTHMLFVNGGNDRVGINVSSPAYTLDVDSTIHIGNDGGSGFTHARTILDSNGAARGIGTFFHNQVNDVEWFAGNPYDDTDSFSINRQATASHADSTSNVTNALMSVDSAGNVLIGGTSTPSSSAGNLALFNGTAPSGSATNGIVLYAEDVSSSSELKVRDEAGNVTTLSPHNFELIPEGPSEEMAWSYFSERDGKRINVDMLKAIRVLEKLSGEQLVFEN